MITIYQIAWNQENIIEFIHSKWKTNFPDAKFVLYDNYSTDNTVVIARQLGYEVVQFETYNQFNDYVHMGIKNACWRNASTDWVVICDLDEFVNISEEQLKNETSSIIRTEGWEMIAMNNESLMDLNHAVRNSRYDKCLIFNKKEVNMQYGAGAHEHFPKGNIKYSKNIYPLLHYKYISEDYYVNRTNLYNDRWSDINLKMKWGFENFNMTEEKLKDKYQKLKEKAIKVL